MASAFNFNTPFESTGAIIENVISGWAENASDLVVGQVGPLIGTLFTIWVIYRALNIMYGVGHERVVDLFLDTVKLAAVGYFALNSFHYVNWIISNAPAVEDFLLGMVPNSPANVWASLDHIWHEGWDAIAQLGSLESGVSWNDFVGSLMLITAMFFVACGIVFLAFMGLTLLVTNKILLVILLGFGPLFMAIGMFPKMREVMWAWVKMCITCIFVMILFAAVVSLVVTIQTGLMTTMGSLALGGDAALMKAFQIGCILFVVCCATGNIFQSIPFIARNLTGAWGVGGGTGGFASHAAAAGLGAVGGAMAAGTALAPAAAAAGNMTAGVGYGARNAARSAFAAAGGQEALARAKAAGAAGATPAQAFGGFMKDLAQGSKDAVAEKASGIYGAAKSFASDPGAAAVSAGAAIKKGMSETYNDGGRGFTSNSARKFLADHAPNMSAGLEGAIAGARESRHERTAGDSTYAAAAAGNVAAMSMMERDGGAGSTGGYYGGNDSSSQGIAQWREAGAKEMSGVGKTSEEIAAAKSGTDSNGIVSGGGSGAGLAAAGAHAAASMQGAAGASGANGTSGTSGANGTSGVSGRNGIDGAPGASAPAAGPNPTGPSGSSGPSGAAAAAAAAMAAGSASGSSASSVSSAGASSSQTASRASFISTAGSSSDGGASTLASAASSASAASAASAAAGAVAGDGSSQASGAAEHSISAMGSSAPAAPSASAPAPEAPQSSSQPAQTPSDEGAQVIAHRAPRMRRGS